MIVPLYCCSDYKVDSDGHILSKRNGKPMKPSINPKGYYTTTVMINGKKKYLTVHSAIAKSFLGDKTKEGLVVNHKDGNKLNNCLENLEWITSKENTLHAINVLHTVKQGKDNPLSKKVIALDKNTNEIKHTFDSLGDAARYFANIKNKSMNTIRSIIWRAIYNQKKSYSGYIWKYVNC